MEVIRWTDHLTNDKGGEELNFRKFYLVRFCGLWMTNNRALWGFLQIFRWKNRLGPGISFPISKRRVVNEWTKRCHRFFSRARARLRVLMVTDGHEDGSPHPMRMVINWEKLGLLASFFLLCCTGRLFGRNARSKPSNQLSWSSSSAEERRAEEEEVDGEVRACWSTCVRSCKSSGLASELITLLHWLTLDCLQSLIQY